MGTPRQSSERREAVWCISGRSGRHLMQHAAMPLTSEELDHLSASTLAHYNTLAEEYWQGIRDHDVSQNIATLL